MRRGAMPWKIGAEQNLAQSLKGGGGGGGSEVVVVVVVVVVWNPTPTPTVLNC